MNSSKGTKIDTEQRYCEFLFGFKLDFFCPKKKTQGGTKHVLVKNPVTEACFSTSCFFRLEKHPLNVLENIQKVL